jgi:hypothetical protein
MMDRDELGGMLIQMEEPVRGTLELVWAALMAARSISDDRQREAMVTLLCKLQDEAGTVKKLWDAATASPA